MKKKVLFEDISYLVKMNWRQIVNWPLQNFKRENLQECVNNLFNLGMIKNISKLKKEKYTKKWNMLNILHFLIKLQSNTLLKLSSGRRILPVLNMGTLPYFIIIRCKGKLSNLAVTSTSAVFCKKKPCSLANKFEGEHQWILQMLIMGIIS